ncbi:MAG: T9SS type A sorting domain-containing protein, partial [Bacteroidales bacterium]|nr:T9SS type A sorting domain-containing protein [Bacteroidales bacterium]
QVIPQGAGTDTVVNPQFGTGMLSFGGSAGSITMLSTRQMDLSQTIQPALSFWYFHDTIPSEDYTDVRITIDGGATYNTLYSLTKYNPVYGWKQYSADLPAYAINQCVILVFEAMEKSRSGDVSQYIDRILITARQDIAVDAIITSELDVCDLENKELKVVMTNLSDPVLNYTTNPTTLTLEVKETGQTYDTLLNSNSLGSFASDTITLATGFNFAIGTYTLKAYFSSVLDVDRNNDTLVVPVVINPELSVQVQSESMSNCLEGELTVHPSIILYNTGNMDLSDIDLTIQIDTGDNNPAVYALFRETYTGTILAGNSAIYIFTNAYSVPWNARYDVRVNASLNCDSALAHNTNMIQECVDVKDLRVVSIDNPTTGTIDNIGSSIQVIATFNNRSDGDIFNSLPVTYSVRNSQGVQTASSTENINIGLSETVNHIFNATYVVPNDTVYYLAVYVESRDNYRNNDTMIMKRETNVGISSIGENNGFTLAQNIPNPAKSSTRIDYSVPESGEVVFHVQSASGQLLYSKTIEAISGKQSLELNTNTLAAGIYFYSIEYKGQRLVKRMSVQK